MPPIVPKDSTGIDSIEQPDVVAEPCVAIGDTDVALYREEPVDFN